MREYIKNQEKHHAKKTFQQEYDEFMERYEFALISSRPESRGNSGRGKSEETHELLRPLGLS